MKEFIQPGSLPKASGPPPQPGPMDAPEQPADENEQAQYMDLWKRAVAFVHDTREDEDGVSPSDRIIDALAVKDVPFHEALGHTVGTIMQLLHNNAKRFRWRLITRSWF